MQVVSIVFDGGSKGNPGDGYGSYVYQGVVERLNPERFTLSGKTTNNQAEYLSLIKAIESVIRDLDGTRVCVADVSLVIYSDSQLLVEQLSGNWKVKNQILRALHQETTNLLSGFESWKIQWHPRSESVRILGH